MDLKETIKINNEIIRLICSKFEASDITGLSGPDRSYAKRLEQDNDKAQTYFDSIASTKVAHP